MPATNTATNLKSVTNLNQQRYDRFVRTFRDSKSAGNFHETSAMFTLIDFEKASICWKTTPSMTFEDILRKERLCTITRYHAFKKAVTIFSRDEIVKLGVESVCLIAQQGGKIRPRLVKAVTEFRKTNEIGPSLQYTANLVQSLRPETARSSEPTYGQLKAYCETLKEEIRELGGRIPPIPAKKSSKKS